MADTHLSNNARAINTMHAAVMAPLDEGCKDSKRRLSPPLKWSQGIIMVTADEFAFMSIVPLEGFVRDRVGAMW